MGVGRKYCQILVLGVAACLVPAGQALRADSVSPVESLGLKGSGRVHEAGTDERSKEFLVNALPKLQEIAKQEFSNQQSISEALSKYGAMLSDRSALSLDPSQLKLQHDANVRVYFVGDSAKYQNSLGYFSTSSGDQKDQKDQKSSGSEDSKSYGSSSSDAIATQADSSGKSDGSSGGDSQKYSSEGSDNSFLKNENARLLFSNVGGENSVVNSSHDGSEKDNKSSRGLSAGDYVNLGRLGAGSVFNPFLIVNGGDGGSTIYSADPKNNKDQTQHFVALAVTSIGKESYILFGVSDIGGEKGNFGDAVFALDIGAGNVGRLASASVPLPSSVLALVGPLACCFWSVARRRSRKNRQAE